MGEHRFKWTRELAEEMHQWRLKNNATVTEVAAHFGGNKNAIQMGFQKYKLVAPWGRDPTAGRSAMGRQEFVESEPTVLDEEGAGVINETSGESTSVSTPHVRISKVTGRPVRPYGRKGKPKATYRRSATDTEATVSFDLEVDDEPKTAEPEKLVAVALVPTSGLLNFINGLRSDK